MAVQIPKKVGHLIRPDAPASEARTALGLGTAATHDAADFATASHAHAIADVTGLQTALDAKASASGLASHVADTANPHGVTKAQIGLGGVDNTSDAAKPISTATQTALDLKAPLASPSFTGTVTLASLAGLLKGTSGVVSAAVAGTDYLAPTGNGSGLTGITSSQVSGSFPESQVTSLVSDLAAKAPLASPALTGTPTAPTATAGTNTTQVATTAFVAAAVAAGGGSATPGGSTGNLQYNDGTSAIAGAGHANYAASGSILTISAGAIADIPLTVNGFSGQTGKLQKWTVNGGSALLDVDASGKIGLGSTRLAWNTLSSNMDIVFANLGVFRAAEYSAIGTADIFFQAVPATSAGWCYFNAYNAAGLALGTAGGSGSPVTIRPNDTVTATFAVGGGLALVSSVADNVVFKVNAGPGQNANILELRSSSDVLLSAFDKDGYGFPRNIKFDFPEGSHVVATDQTAPFRTIIDRPTKLRKVFLFCTTAPTGADLIVDIYKSSNGGSSWTSLWASTPSNRPKIVAGATSGTATSFDTTTLAEGDLLRYDIVQIGSTVAGTGLIGTISAATRNL